MKPPLKKLHCFGGALLLGALPTVLLFYVHFKFNPVTTAVAAFCAGICLLLFGRPHKNPAQGQIGWGLLGLAAGLIMPIAMYLTFSTW